MKKRPVCIVCIGLMIAVWICRTAGIPIFGEPSLTSYEKERIGQGQLVLLTGTVSDRSESEDSVRYTLRNACAAFRGRQVPLSGVFVSTEYYEEKALPGDLLTAYGELRPLEKAGNPGQFDSASYYGYRGIRYRMRAEGIPEIRKKYSPGKTLFRLREKLTDLYADCMREDTAGILSAMLMGDKSFLTEESRRAFQSGGCMHLLVISGLHVVLLGMSLLKLLLRLRLPRTAASVTAGGCMVFYTLLTGAPAAAVRACIMFLVFVFAKVLRRSYDSACALAFSAILMLLVQPGLLFSAGFQLSFAAAAGAALVSPALSRALPAVPGPGTFPAGSRKRNAEGPKRRRIGRCLLLHLRDSSILWCAVQLCTLPMTAYYFYEIPVWSLPLNLLLVPLVPYILGAGAAGSLAALLLPQAGRWLLLPADLGLGLFDRILDLARRVPGSSVVCGKPALWQVVAYYICMLALLGFLTKKRQDHGSRFPMRKCRDQKIFRIRIKGRRGRRISVGCAALAAAACSLLFARTFPEFSLTMLDVGQGDCLVIQTEKNVFLSDGGSTTVPKVGQYRILPYLESRGIGYVEAVFVSHDDADHEGGIEEILRLIAEKKTAVRIGHVFLPKWMAQTEDGERILTECHAAGAVPGLLERGDSVQCGEMRIDVLHPFHEGGAQEGNAGSLVLQVSYEGFTALLTGDLEKEGEEELIPYLSDIDCLKAGHHGSRNSTSEDFLEVTDPEIALISAPKKSMYGHPHQETLDRLEASGAAIFATKDCGAVTVLPEDGGISVRTFLQTDGILR